MPTWILLLVLVGCLALGYFVFQIAAALQDKEREALRARLDAFNAADASQSAENFLKNDQVKHSWWVKLLLFREGWAEKLWKMMRQAKVDMSLGTFILLSLALSAFGLLLASVLGWGHLAQAGVALALLFAPAWWVRRKAAKRAARFEDQFPEALDLIGRSLKAGHTFTSGMTMVAQEFADPIREEFRQTIEEINYGGHLHDALDNLAERVDTPDLLFFVASVKIQSETGGKLTEIMESISYLIRERMKLKGKVAALSAEGRYSGYVMFLLPPLMLVVLMLLNPKYMSVMFDTEIGHYMLYTAGAMLLAGMVAISRMVNIRV
ncbi:type II secretion system F family protein [Fundidesulfovibrio agrisoli]|uniref:type II secretion system F family protein n=1 Tax=Fundidesulfovibrio agrisoli TaxID=2922717 RepID=UPI001FAC68A0|nr:type II secretion system F family protein [Fundidesulfovibrio agrisoli]